MPLIHQIDAITASCIVCFTFFCHLFSYLWTLSLSLLQGLRRGGIKSQCDICQDFMMETQENSRKQREGCRVATAKWILFISVCACALFLSSKCLQEHRLRYILLLQFSLHTLMTHTHGERAGMGGCFFSAHVTLVNHFFRIREKRGAGDTHDLFWKPQKLDTKKSNESRICPFLFVILASLSVSIDQVSLHLDKKAWKCVFWYTNTEDELTGVTRRGPVRGLTQRQLVG